MEIAWGDWSLLDNRPRREDTGTTDDRGEKAGATLTAACKEVEGCWGCGGGLCRGRSCSGRSAWKFGAQCVLLHPNGIAASRKLRDVLLQKSLIYQIVG